MKPSLAFKLIISMALLALSMAAFAASGNPPAKSAPTAAEQTIDVQFTDTPLPVALDAMFKNTGKSYVLDPNLAQFRVARAVLKNVSWETGLTQLLTAIGAAYYTGKDGVYHITLVPQQVMTQQNFYSNSAVPPAGPAAASRTISEPTSGDNMSRQPQVTTNVIDTKYINAAEAANAIANTPGISSVSATNGNRVVIVGTPEGNNAASQVIAGLDTDKTFPRPVRLKMLTKVTVGSTRGPKSYEASTESVGAEQSQMLLHLDVRDLAPVSKVAPEHMPKAAPNNLRPSLLYATIVPSLNPDGRIGLVGRGRFAFPMGPGQGSEVTKEFVVTASVEPGKPFTIAAGSMRLQIGKVDFAVTVTATQEQGRVYLSPSQNSILNAMPGPPVPSGRGDNPSIGGGYSTPDGRNW